MREYWIDHLGTKRPLVKSKLPLKFSYPSHRALRAYIFYRDKFTCKHCGIHPASMPTNYDGSGYILLPPNHRDIVDYLVLDHVKALKNGGRSHPDNLQTLCDSCNKRKGNLLDKRSKANV